jgi:hypothetical protein
MRKYVLAIILFIPAGTIDGQKTSPVHQHPQILQAPAKWRAAVKIIKVKRPRRPLTQVDPVRSKAFEGFSVYRKETGYRLFYTDREAAITYEIRGVGQPHRPFSDLRWRDDRIFVFDSWSTPDHGVHYEFDAKSKKMRKILIIRDDGN